MPSSRWYKLIILSRFFFGFEPSTTPDLITHHLKWLASYLIHTYSIGYSSVQREHKIPDPSPTLLLLCVVREELFVTVNTRVTYITYVEMDVHKSHKNHTTESRFGTLLFLLRMGGIAVNMKTQPTTHIVYNVCLVLCYYVTFLSVFLDYLQKTDNLKESMKNVRLLFAMGYISWIHLSLRYFSL
jgi:hypothetical protein